MSWGSSKDGMISFFCGKSRDSRNILGQEGKLRKLPYTSTSSESAMMSPKLLILSDPRARA